MKKVSVSPLVLFASACVIILVSFVAGTRESQWHTVLSQVFNVPNSKNQASLASLQQTYDALVQRYDGKLSTQQLIDGANRGLVSAAGDKFTEYFTAAEAKQFQDELSGKVGAGIGAQVGVRNGQPVIERLLPDNPAVKSGLQQGDILTSVDDQSVKDWSADKVASKIRGKEGTQVKVAVLRNNQALQFTITRATINNPSVSSSINGTIGIMSIYRFDEQTGDLARQAANDFKQKGVKAVIVDLRGDGGGYLDGAVAVAKLWLKDGATIMTQRQNGKVQTTYTADGNAPLQGIKTTILIDGGSASASEILAAALRDNGAATLLGEKSYGKGSVQEVIPLSGGAELKVTIAHWYTPNNQNVGGKGLAPDQEVKFSQSDTDSGRDTQLDAAKANLDK